MDDKNATYNLEEFVEEPCEEIDQGPFEIANGEMAGLEQLEDGLYQFRSNINFSQLKL